MARFLRDALEKLVPGRSSPRRTAANAPKIQGHVDRVTRQMVSGWAFERLRGAESRPVKVSVWLGDQPLCSGVADLPRPGVQQAYGVDPRCGFKLTFDSVKPDQLLDLKVTVQGTGGSPIPFQIPASAYRQGSRNHQDLSSLSEGHARSHERLVALRLPRLGRADSPRRLRGMSLLDLSCNEGFFCIEALKMGAAHVVGIDRVQRHVDAARERCLEGQFIHGSWWDLPPERFDIILLLSALQHEPNQKALLQKLRHHLKPGGHLVLECGLASEPGVRAWHRVASGDKVYRYPTRDLLVHDLLADYSVRNQGRSVIQVGDPMSRFVFHCSPKKPTAILIAGCSQSGKSNLGFDLVRRGIPTLRTDNVLGHMLSGHQYGWSPVAPVLVKEFGSKNPKDLAAVGRYIVQKKLADAFAELIAAEAPKEAGIFAIEGEALRHPSVSGSLAKQLEASGVRVWIMQPAADVLPAQGVGR